MRLEKRPVQYLFVLLLMVGVFVHAPAQKKKRKREEDIGQVIAMGRSYIGTPYQWGGMSKSGIDCSGLIYNSYQSIGIQMPRTSEEQSKTGQKRGWEGISEGDLVFFKFRRNGKKWYHSGMITHMSENKILFIHSSSSKGVVESDLLAEYYKDNVINFRRVID